MKHAFRLILILLATSATHGFADSPDSVGEKGLKWDRSSLRICFVREDQQVSKDFSTWTSTLVRHSSFTEVRKNTVRGLLLTNYPESLTGISLVGFQECSSPLEKSDADVFLVNDVFVTDPDVREGASGISMLGDPGKRFHDTKSAIGLNHREARELRRRSFKFFADKVQELLGASQDPVFEEKVRTLVDGLELTSFKYTLLHEFGHVLGLRHEDARADVDLEVRDSYKMCGWAADASTGMSVLENGELDTFGTRYDALSIMSYCRLSHIFYVHQARLVCAYRKELSALQNLEPEVKDSLDHLFPYCDFVAENDFPVGITSTDRAGISKLYGTHLKSSRADLDPIRSSTKRTWLNLGAMVYNFQLAIHGFVSDATLIKEMRKEGLSYLRDQ